MSFTVVVPHPISDAQFINSTVAEPDTTISEPSAYNAGTSYSIGQQIHLVATHKIYESLTNSNVGNYPADEVQGDIDNPPTNWLEIKSTNKWDILDYGRNTKTVAASPYVFTLKPEKRFDALVLLGASAQMVLVEVIHDSEVVYSSEKTLNNRTVESWYDYFFAEVRIKPSEAWFDLPLYSQAEVRITLSSESGDVALGACVLGRSYILGDGQYGMVRDAINYSNINTNFDGTTTFFKRPAVPTLSAKIIGKKTSAAQVSALLDGLDAVPAVYLALENSDDEFFEPFTILGVCTQRPLQAFGPTEFQLDLIVKEILR